MAFLQEPEPARGVRALLLPGISRVVARNPGIMTYHGTNTYFVQGESGVSIIDPGPDDAAHVADILRLAAAPITHILLTHTHADHMGAAKSLQAASGAPVISYNKPARPGFMPDIGLEEGAMLAGFTAVHTPGHAADHLCYAYQLADGRQVLFSGDHVMSWSSSIVSPPEGDMRAYYRSLALVLARSDDEFYLPGHGPLLPQPQNLAAALLAHRKLRETAILDALVQKPQIVAELAAALYGKTDIRLKFAAQRNVLAHMLKLLAENIVEEMAPATQDHPDTLSLRPLSQAPGVTAADINTMLHDARRCFALIKQD